MVVGPKTTRRATHERSFLSVPPVSWSRDENIDSYLGDRATLSKSRMVLIPARIPPARIREPNVSLGVRISVDNIT